MTEIEIARLLGIEPYWAARIMRALHERGIVHQDDDGRWSWSRLVREPMTMGELAGLRGKVAKQNGTAGNSTGPVSRSVPGGSESARPFPTYGVKTTLYIEEHPWPI